MSKMLRSLLDELDAEFNVRRDEWNKVHEILSVKVALLCGELCGSGRLRNVMYNEK